MKNMEKIFLKIKKETLSQDEKTEILSVLRSFVDKNPVQRITSPFPRFWFTFKKKAVLVPAILVLVFAVGIGTVFASKNSLPGSVLYPVKMFKEKVESATATNTKVKAEVETVHAISRLQEVEQIVVSNKQFGKGEGKEISNNFDTQVQGARENINRLEEDGKKEEAEELRSNFKSSLTEYEKKITELSKKSSEDTKEELSHVISNINSQLKDISDESEKNKKSRDRSDSNKEERKKD